MNNRSILNFLYASLLIWVLIYILGRNFLLTPFIIVYWYIYPYGAIAFAIIMLFMNSKWKSEERIAAWFFLLPIIFSQVVPFVHNQVQLHLAAPSDQLVMDFINDEFAGIGNVLDTTFPLINYDTSNKKMEVYLKIDPDIYMDYYEKMSKKYKGTDEKFKHSLIRKIKSIFNLMTRFNKRNLVPDKITVSVYWGGSLLGKAYFIRDKDQYNMVEPYPDVSLIRANNKWYWKYRVDGQTGTIFLKERQGPDFEIGWDEMGTRTRTTRSTNSN